MDTINLTSELFSSSQKEMQDLLESKGLTLKKFNDEDQRVLFNAASGFYQIGQFDEAALIFKSLLLTAPLNPTYWQSLASALQMNKQYDAALQAWALFANFDQSNPLAPLRCAECLILQDKIEQAKESLIRALGLVGEKHLLKDEVERLAQAWEVQV